MSAISSYYMPGGLGKQAEINLEKFALNKDDDGYYLTARFKVEDKQSIRELNVPKIRLRIKPENISLKVVNRENLGDDAVYINLGFGDLPLGSINVDGRPVWYSEKIIEEKYTEMTMDEIEKKLGYKVKIVNK